MELRTAPAPVAAACRSGVRLIKKRLGPNDQAGGNLSEITPSAWRPRALPPRGNIRADPKRVLEKIAIQAQRAETTSSFSCKNISFEAGKRDIGAAFGFKKIERLSPLIEKLPPMHQNQRVCLSRRNHPGGNHGVICFQ